MGRAGPPGVSPRCVRPRAPLRAPRVPFSLNFKDPEAVRALTCTLLKEDFGLTIDIPVERLIPTVPLRLNYIHWVEDLIGHRDADKQTLRRGIDIGKAKRLFTISDRSRYNLLHGKTSGLRNREI